MTTQVPPAREVVVPFAGTWIIDSTHVLHTFDLEVVVPFAGTWIIPLIENGLTKAEVVVPFAGTWIICYKEEI